MAQCLASLDAAGLSGLGRTCSTSGASSPHAFLSEKKNFSRRSLSSCAVSCSRAVPVSRVFFCGPLPLPGSPGRCRLTMQSRWDPENGGGDGGGVDYSQRILSSAAYFLPLLDGLQFGTFLFRQYPVTRVVVEPLLPLLQAYRSVPFAGFIVFLVLYNGVIRNTRLSRYVRYNVMQAIVLDVLLFLPSLLRGLLSGGDTVSVQLLVTMYNTVFLYLVACFFLGVGSCILGKTPRLPLVAEAADAQVPF